MDFENFNEERTTSNRIYIFQIFDELKKMSYVIALELAVAAEIILLPICYFVLELESNLVFKIGIVAFVFPFILVIGEKVGRLWAKNRESAALMAEATVRIAEAQAKIERATGIDWNRSGQVGDVVTPELPAPQVQRVVEHHLINTNLDKDKHVVMVGEYELEKDYLIEFIQQIETRGIKRGDWLQDGNKPAYKFLDGEFCTREIYDACIKVLDERVHAIKGNGTNRRVIYNANQILEYLAL